MGRKITAFTLIELLIVIAIIAILVIVALMYFRGQIFKGNDARRKSDINRIKIAVEEYEKDHNCYPLPSLMSCNPGTGLVPYINKIPCDPITNASYYYEHQDSVCPGWYRIYTKLDNTADTQAVPYIGPNKAYNYVSSSTNAPGVTAGSSTSAPSGGGGGGGGGGGPQSGFYGCKGGVCVPIAWDASRPGPACDPNYQNSTCYNQCGPSQNECVPWH